MDLTGGLTGIMGITVDVTHPGEAVGRLPVDERHLQPFGLVHGGVYAVLAETVASVGGHALVVGHNQGVVGQQVSVNLVRPGKIGMTLIGRGECSHRGQSSQVWDVEITDATDPDRLLAMVRILLAVVPA